MSDSDPDAPDYPCRAFLIDPFVLITSEGRLSLSARPAIREVPHDGSIHDIYRRLSTPDRRVSVMEACYIDGRIDGNVMYVDEEGLLYPATHFIRVDGFPNPVAGRGYVLGTNSEGYSVSPDITLEALWSRVSIAVGNVEVRLSQVKVGSPVPSSAVSIGEEQVAHRWATEIVGW